MGTKTQLKTPAEVRAEFARTGQSISAWARANGVQVNTVYAILDGKKKGLRGEAHKVAVLLGIKNGVIVDNATGKRRSS